MCKCDFTCAATIQSLLKASKQIMNLLTQKKGKQEKSRKSQNISRVHWDFARSYDTSLTTSTYFFSNFWNFLNMIFELKIIKWLLSLASIRPISTFLALFVLDKQICVMIVWRKDENISTNNNMLAPHIRWRVGGWSQKNSQLPDIAQKKEPIELRQVDTSKKNRISVFIIGVGV
jgi:hypothetical protein